MDIIKAIRILKSNGVTWSDYFDLIKYKGRGAQLDFALDRVKTFIIWGR